MKKISIGNNLILGFHPMLDRLMENDPISLKSGPDISILSTKQLSILCKNIMLNVMQSGDGKYLLLSPNLIYNQLIQHPAAKNEVVNVLIHSPESEQELLALIDTLNLVQPALSLLESANKSKTINARYLQLNKMGYKPTPLTFLAKLANKCPSTLRG
ncbi:hypothetical protein [Psychromonas sp. Urea-02u-13]|uniref:hypothetical protein n=1 Tax=Psychromonas sp. Urea-02u-13 TaxID=2058326 RepID=UPI000C337AE1|nr:hypothetical protein [Psychromonas sp. Urea-02u-13]PKG40442.1 hypothetical protein CXF74_02305 [Psychromonas sp. Urea-02u-13]